MGRSLQYFKCNEVLHIEFNVVKEYDLPDMSFESIDELVSKLKTSKEFAEKYVFHYESGGVPKEKLTASNCFKI